MTEIEIPLQSATSALERPAVDASAIEQLRVLMSEGVPGSTLSEEQQRKLEGEIVTALLRYKARGLPVHTSKPSSFKFWSFLGAGVVSIGAGSLTLGLGDKPGTLRTIVGSLGIGVGTVSLAGAVMTFPTQRETVSYTLVYKLAKSGTTHTATIILPLELSDLEFVQTSVQQLSRQLDAQCTAQVDNPAESAFDLEQKEDVIGPSDPSQAGSPVKTPNSLGGFDSDQEAEPEPLVPEPASEPSLDKKDAAEEPEAKNASAAPSQRSSDIDDKYGSVIKQPKKPQGINEHTSLF